MSVIPFLHDHDGPWNEPCDRCEKPKAGKYKSRKMDDYKVRLALALDRMFPDADGTYTTDQVMEAIEVVGQ